MSRIVTKEEAIRVLNKIERLAKARGEMTKIMYEESTSYARYGRYPTRSIESAIDIAERFVIDNNHRGISARVEVTVYAMKKDGWLAERTVCLNSPFNGKRNHIGYALPDENRLDEAEYVDWGH